MINQANIFHINISGNNVNYMNECFFNYLTEKLEFLKVKPPLAEKNDFLILGENVNFNDENEKDKKAMSNNLQIFINYFAKNVTIVNNKKKDKNLFEHLNGILNENCEEIPTNVEFQKLG